MNKKFFRHITALFCALYFLLAGTGFNIVNYCCTGCSEMGIEAVASQSCHAIHHEDSNEHEGCCSHDAQKHAGDMACSDTSHQTDDCHLLRIQTDTPSVDVATNYQPADEGITLELPFAILSLLHQNEATAQHYFSSYLNTNLPLYSGRDVLTLHAVLLI